MNKKWRANDEIWTRDLFLTKETLYPWATPAEIWAGDRVRTGDIQLGRLTLYQLSYSRLNCGESRIRTCEVKNSRFTVCPRWPLEYLPNINFEPMEGLEPTTCWLQISCSSQLSYIGLNILIEPKYGLKWNLWNILRYKNHRITY